VRDLGEPCRAILFDDAEELRATGKQFGQLQRSGPRD